MSKLKSRKFWMALLTALLVLLKQGLDVDVDQDTVLGFAGIVMTYLASQGWVDAQEAKTKGGEKAND